MNTILNFFAIVLCAYLLISLFMFIYWHFNRDVRDRNEKYTYTVFCGTLIGLTIIAGEGLTTLLIFIPKSWVSYNASGEFVTTRRVIGYFIGFAAAMALIQLMGKVESLEDEHKAMRHELAVRRYLDELGSLTPNAKRARVASLAEELQDMKRRKYLSRQEKNHIRVLEDVIDVLSESR